MDATWDVILLLTLVIIAYSILAAAEPAAGYANRDTVYLCVCLATGLVFGLLLAYFVRLGIAVIGGIGGFSLAVFILSWGAGGLITSYGGRIAFMAVLSLVGALLAFWLERPIVYFATSMAGAMSIVYGVDVFARKGLQEAVRIFLNSGNRLEVSQYTLTPSIYGYLASVIVITLIGILVQYKMNKNYTIPKK